MFQWTKEVMDGYVRLRKSLSSKCRGSKSSSSSFFSSSVHSTCLCLTINAAQFDSVHKSIDQN